MIIDFEFSNYRSFRAKQSFSMRRDTSIKNSKPSIEVGYVKEGLMRVVALYGANASGKTGFLSALNSLRDAVTSSFPRSGFTESSREPFLVDNRMPTRYGISFIAEDKKKYQYELELDDERVLYEYLSVYNTAKPTLVYEREYQEGVDVYNFGSAIPKEKTDVLRALIENTPTVLFLSAAMQVKEESLKPVYSFFFDNLKKHDSATVGMESEVLKTKLKQKKDLYDILQRLLPSADFGVCGVEAEEKDTDFPISDELRDLLKHEVRQFIKQQNPNMSDEELDKVMLNNQDEKPLSLVFKHQLGDSVQRLGQKFESSGTIAATVFFSNLIGVLKEGRVYVVDEIDCSLHPTLVSQLIEVFNSEEANPFGAQLIFTTHDVSMLDPSIYGESLLDRDEIWFVEKNRQGESNIYPLTSVKNGVSKGDNYYKKYVQGRYGAVPKASILNEVIDYWVRQDVAKS